MNKTCVENYIYLFVILLTSFFFTVTSAAAETHVIKFATLAPEGSTWMKTMRALEKTIKEKSRGEVLFRVYAGGVAGDELDVLKKIRIGQIHAAAFSGVGFGEILPLVRVLDLPFLFRNGAEVDRVVQELEDHFSNQFLAKGFVLLSWAEVGDVHLFSKHPIRKLEDMARVKVWTWSGDPIAKETFTQMGTVPIPLSITDVITSLNTGMIDTVYAPPLGALALQWNRYVKFMTSLPLAHSTGAVLISAETFKKIPEIHSRMVKEEFKAAMVRLTGELREQSQESIRAIEKSGVTILPMPSDADLNPFYRVHDQVAAKLAGDLFPKELLERINKILATMR